MQKRCFEQWIICGSWLDHLTELTINGLAANKYVYNTNNEKIQNQSVPHQQVTAFNHMTQVLFHSDHTNNYLLVVWSHKVK